MVLEMSFVRSRVARRIVRLFVICALVPISVLGLLSYRQVTRHLAVQARSRLQLYSKSTGMAIYERLVSLLSEMQILAAQHTLQSGVTRLPNPSEEYRGHLDLRFLALDFIPDRGERLHLFGEERELPEITALQIQHALSGEPLVFARRSASGTSRIFMATPLGQEMGSKGLLLSELRGSFLWFMGEENTLPPGAELQVLGPDQQLIFTSIPELTALPPPALDLIQKSSAGGFKWRIGREDYLAGFWQLFMESRFHASGWTVVVSESESFLNAPLTHFKRVFPLVLVLSLWVIVLLSLIQIRRSLVPLEKLKVGTKRMARGEFETRVDIKRHDEFGELAAAFNEMAVELGRQFKTLNARAKIDRAVLAAMDTRVIASTFVQSMSLIFPCQGAGFILLGEDEPFRGKFYLTFDESRDLYSEPVQLDPNDVRNIENNRDVCSVQYPDHKEGFLSVFTQRGLSSFHIFPVFIKQDLMGIIILGYKDEQGFMRTGLDQVRQMADQVGVALTNARLVKDLRSFHWGALTALARAIDAKSHWTAGHSEKVTQLAVEIGRAMNLSQDELNILRSGGLLHDIGKLGIPNRILDKDGPLTAEERTIINTHPRLGARILEPIAAFKSVVDIVLHHHENFDGTGYPERLCGEDITLYSRIFAVADRFEAMTSDRPYRQALSQDSRILAIKKQSGRHFDPGVVKAFLQVMAQRQEFRDNRDGERCRLAIGKDPSGNIHRREGM